MLPVEEDEPEPVDVDVDVELLDPVELVVGVELVVDVVGVAVDVELEVEGAELVVLDFDAVVVVWAATVAAAVFLASAGSWPVTSRTAMSDHTPMNRATVAPTTRARMSRTRSRRAFLICTASSRVMQTESGRRVAAACGAAKSDV